jgi:phage pi2 protein 07
MAKILTIPKEILKKGDLVLIPRKEYEELLKLRKKKQWEDKDTEEAIRVFKEEKKKNKLRKINSLVELE